MKNIRQLTKAEELNNRGVHLYQEGKLQEALDIFNKVNEEDMSYLDAYYNKGLCLVMLDKFDEARRCYETILIVDKAQGEAYWHLGNLEYMFKNNNTKALEQYNKAIYYGFEDDTVYINKGMILEEQEDYQEALRCYNKVLHKNKLNANARIRKAEVYIKLKKIEEALRTYDELIMYNPDLPEGYHFKFAILVAKGDIKEAEKLINKASIIFPDEEIIALDRIQIYQSNERYEDALAIIEEYLLVCENKIPFMIKKGIILSLKGDTQHSIEVLKNVLEIDCNLLEPHHYLANIYMSNERYDEALGEFEFLVNSNDSNNSYRIAALYYYPVILKHLDKNDEAKLNFEKAIQEYRLLEMYNPGDIDILISKTLCYKDLELYDEALDSLDYILTLDSNIGEAYFIKAQIFKILGNEEESKININLAIEKNPLFKELKMV